MGQKIDCLAAVLLLTSCAVGPNYRKPPVTDLTPADWHWKLAEPRDQIPKGPWWTLFHEPQLDRLESAALRHNQNLQAAVARVDQARAAARLSRSQFFPELALDPLARRERTSGHLPTPIPFRVPSAYVDTFSVPLDLSYEVDLWGRVRRSFESSRAQAQASVAEEQNVLLTLTADVAVNYFLICSLDVERARLEKTVQLYDDSVRILAERFAAGVTPEIDLAQAKTETASAKADLADTTRQRAEVANALALLCGESASAFELASARDMPAVVLVPPGLPSELLERRPDIARAERTLAARNAEIGVARSAYFPALRLTGQAGYLSAGIDDLFASDNRVWSIGPSVSLPLFNAGRTKAGVQRAEAAYAEALADYRETILAAFKDVEDSLADLRLRKEQAAAVEEALLSARHVTQLATARYEAGSANYLEVIDAERKQLEEERQQARVGGQQLTANVRLIKALGGGWGDEVHSNIPGKYQGYNREIPRTRSEIYPCYIPVISLLFPCYMNEKCG